MDQIHLRSHLLEQHPQDVEKWLQIAMDSALFAPEDFQWWLGLAQGATSHAESGFKSDEPSQALAVMWARVGVTIYEYLLAQLSNASHRFSLEMSLMWLRTFFIIKLGTVRNDPLLDVDQIMQWFFQDLPYSLQELIKLIEVWQDIKRQPIVLKQLFNDKHMIISGYLFNVSHIKDMRLVKNKLNIMKALLDAEMLPLAQREELYSWLPLWEKLP